MPINHPLSDALRKELTNLNGQLYKVCKKYDENVFNTCLDDIEDAFNRINVMRTYDDKVKLGEVIAECILVNEGSARDEKHLAIKNAILMHLHEHIAVVKRGLIDKEAPNDKIKKGFDNVIAEHANKKKVISYPKLTISTSHDSLVSTNLIKRRMIAASPVVTPTQGSSPMQTPKSTKSPLSAPATITTPVSKSANTSPSPASADAKNSSKKSSQISHSKHTEKKAVLPVAVLNDAGNQRKFKR